ncbi:MAG: sulfatase-like hydrolase/transferase [Candidatus Marinimicrobia bacterium]|nr:sulfatase-like hydrolase/transferase [Candidatus Neomarinimicrobiota bacterium]
MKHSRRDFLKKVGLGASALALSSLTGYTGCNRNKSLPNIILILTDDQGYHDLGCFGAEDFKTPNIDRLAREGMRFTDFHVSQAVCSASRAALMTGCYSERISLQGALMPWSALGLNPEEETIADILKRKNYKTGIFGKWHLGHHKKFLPLQQGFDEYLGLPYSNDMWPVDYDGTPVSAENYKIQYPPLPLIQNNDPVDTIKNLKDQAALTTRYTEAAVDFIKRNRKDPFFLYVPHSMPHVPLGVSEKFRGKSKQGLYGDVIMEIDWSVGEIVKTLEKYQLVDHTLIIFTSDNGPWLNFGNHAGCAEPLREGKGTIFEGGPRVPCVMKWEGHIPENTVCEKLTSTIDLLPTLAEITGAGLPKKTIDGVSILPLMLGDKQAEPRREFYYYYDAGLCAVRRDDWKLQFLHRTRSYSGVEPGKDGYPGEYNYLEVGQELYNLRQDIRETSDLSAKYPEIVKELEKLGELARQKLGDQITGVVGSEIRQPGRLGLEDNPRVDHLAKGKRVTIASPYHPKYTGGGDTALTDGIRGTWNFNDGAWQGFEYSHLEAIIDLEKEQKINQITVGFLENQGSWIFTPQKVEYFISIDGHDYKKVFEKSYTIEPKNNVKVKDISIGLDDQKARYIKVLAENQQVCPDWHVGKGGRTWLFVDEIIVK